MASWTERARNSIYQIMNNGDLSVENAVIVWTNFAGAPTKFNPQGGKRTFNLVVTKDIADTLVANGWNVKERMPEDPADESLYFTEVVVNMDSSIPPTVNLVTEHRGKHSVTKLDAVSVGDLDNYIYENVDVVVHPYAHGRIVSSGSTVKGYLKTMYVTPHVENDFGGKYNFDNEEDEALPFPF